MLRAVSCTAVFLLALSSLPVTAEPVILLSRADPDRPSGTAGGTSRVMRISSDGRYVVFVTNADNFLPGVVDGNGGNDVFLHDRIAGITVLVSHAAGDPMAAGEAESGFADMSADGRWVVFQSSAADLVAGQVEAPGPDIFLWDRDTGTTTLASHLPGLPTQEVGDCWGTPAISSDGSRLAFSSSSPDVVGQSDHDFSTDLFLYDRTTDTNTLASHVSGAATVAAGGVGSIAISGDGNWVAFDSDATDLVAGQVDANNGSDLFLYDRATNTSLLISHAAGGPATAGDDRSYAPRISADGGRVAYLSVATNLMAGQVDGNADYDVFLYDRATGTSALASHAQSGAGTAGNFFSMEPEVSADGRYVAYVSQATDLVPASTGNWLMIFVYDQVTGTNVIVSRGAVTPTGDGFRPRISPDGSWIAFVSSSTNLVPGQTDTLSTWDVFLWSRASGSSILVTRLPGSATTAAGSDGELAELQISADGNWIALGSSSETLVDGIDDHNASMDVFLYSRATAVNTLLTSRGGAVSASAAGAISYQSGSAMSNDGRFVTFTSSASNLPGITDANKESDVFLYDRITGAITLVSHASGSLSTTANGSSDRPVPSADGTAVVFTSTAFNLVPGQPSLPMIGIYHYDRRTGEIALVSRVAGSPSTPASVGTFGHSAVSGDGRWVAFDHYGSDLVAGQVDSFGTPDIFLFDRATGVTVLVSHASSSLTQSGDGFSGAPSISADGRYVVYTSSASDLVPGQPEAGGTFLYDRMTGTNTRVASSDDRPPRISADGRWVVFASSDTDVVPGQVDTNSAFDVFLWDRVSGSTLLVSRTPASATTTGDAESTLSVLTLTPGAPVISADGRWVVFASEATNLVAGQQGSRAVFLFDRVSGTVTLVSRSVAAPTTTGNRFSAEPAISADGRFVAYTSLATDLVPGQMEQNTFFDIFLYDRTAGTTSLVSHIPSSEVTTGAEVSGNLTVPRISADGAWIAFQSASPDLVAGDHDGAESVFLHANPLPGRDLYTVPPCRILDTRQAGQGPILTSGLKRTVMVHGVCGIPATARAVAVNVTVFQPSASGNLSFYAGDLAPSGTSTINFPPGETRANNAILSLALDGTGNFAVTPFVAGNGTVHLIVDASGYFE